MRLQRCHHAHASSINKPPPQVRCHAVRDVVVGIDLGTTNSAVAIVEGGKPVCIPNTDGDTTTPSIVSVLGGGKVVVGKLARRQAVLHPDATYYSVKRLIGRPYIDPAVQEEVPRVAYQVRFFWVGCAPQLKVPDTNSTSV